MYYIIILCWIKWYYYFNFIFIYCLYAMFVRSAKCTQLIQGTSMIFK